MPDRADVTFATILADVALATTCLTRLRWPAAAAAARDRSLGSASWSFSLVGAGIGLAAGLVYWIAYALALGEGVAALAAIGTAVVATGGFHEDGLADAADGLGGSGRDSILAIMRDDRVGTFGTLALILGIGLKAAALIEIAAPLGALAALVAAASVSRVVMVVVMAVVPIADDRGLAAQAGRAPRQAAIAATAIAAAVALLAVGAVAGVVALAAAFAAGFMVVGIAVRRIGGYTGDILGATQQVSEVAVLVALVAFRDRLIV